MKTLETYSSYNERRYGDPWVAKVGADGKIDFSARVGGYTGERGKGEAGDLYIIKPAEGQVYAYGQKDYRGHNGGYQYTQYIKGEFVPVEKTELVQAIEKMKAAALLEQDNGVNGPEA